MRTVILCGGKGPRARPETETVPKPLLEVGRRPVVRHVMDIYAAQGFTEFVLAAGYRADLISAFAHSLPEEWEVEVVDSGEDAGTAERVSACLDRLDETFFVTYADGLADVDLPRLLGFHRAHGGSATVTAIPLPSPFGTLSYDEQGQVSGFFEKPRLSDHRINGGFFVFDRSAFAEPGEDLEREVLPKLAERGLLYAFDHLGFWRSLDTYKDAIELSTLCEKGEPPWTMLPARESS